MFSAIFPQLFPATHAEIQESYTMATSRDPRLTSGTKSATAVTRATCWKVTRPSLVSRLLLVPLRGTSPFHTVEVINKVLQYKSWISAFFARCHQKQQTQSIRCCIDCICCEIASLAFQQIDCFPPWLRMLWSTRFSEVIMISSLQSQDRMSSGSLSSACAKCRSFVSYQHPCSMTPTSVCSHVTHKHIVIVFQGFAQPRLKLLPFAESMHVTGMRVYRFKRVHLPCPCGQLFVQVFPPSPMLRHCAICNRAGNQEAHTQEHTWLITTRQNSPHPSNDSPPQILTYLKGTQREVAKKNCPWTGWNLEQNPAFMARPIESAIEKKWGGKEENIYHVLYLQYITKTNDE